ncbi:MAG: energy-coupling factor ABC transporter permease [Nocardioides sp.]
MGAFVSVLAAALGFAGLFAVGGTAPVSPGTVATAMLTWHSLIGAGEAAITFLIVSAVVAVRPDLVYGARRLLAARTLVVRTGEAA